MAKIISIETSTEVCSVALGVDGVSVSLRESTQGRNHANSLAMYIDELLNENDLSMDEIDAVAVSAGPGSYTGLRIGASTAKGLCYAKGKPLIAIGSLEALAYAAYQEYQAGVLIIDNPDSALLVPMIDARRMEVYTQVYDMKLTALTQVEALVVEPDSFKEFIGSEREVILLGDGADKCRSVLDYPNVRVAKVLSTARAMVWVAEKYYNEGRFMDVAYWEPTYLKDFMVTTQKKRLF